MEKFLNVSEFAKSLKLGKRKIYQDIDGGLIRHHRVGKRILIPESSREEYLGPAIGGDIAEQIAGEVISKINDKS